MCFLAPDPVFCVFCSVSPTLSLPLSPLSVGHQRAEEAEAEAASSAAEARRAAKAEAARRGDEASALEAAPTPFVRAAAMPPEARAEWTACAADAAAALEVSSRSLLAPSRCPIFLCISPFPATVILEIAL